MKNLRWECEANVEYSRLTSTIVVAAEGVAATYDIAFPYDRAYFRSLACDELLIRVRALQEWRKRQ